MYKLLLENIFILLKFDEDSFVVMIDYEIFVY